MQLNGWSPLVVATKPLAGFMTLWVMQQDWDEDYEKGAVIGPKAWLAQETGLSERSIRRVLNAETKFTTLELAEALCMAVGRPDLLSPGGLLEIVPNPMWSSERWLEWHSEMTCDD
jgi:hypothetical protein